MSKNGVNPQRSKTVNQKQKVTISAVISYQLAELADFHSKL